MTPVPSLIVHQGTNRGRRLPLDKARLTIGRGENADLPFADSKLSREHAEFTRGDGGWSLRDLASRNGTFLNGRKLAGEAVTLATGDRIALGLVELEFTLTSAATDAAVAARPGAVDATPAPETAGAGAATQAAFPAFIGTHLRVLSGTLAGRDLALGERTVLGRSAADADVSLDDPAASRRNTEIILDGAVWRIRDLGSRNGTELDGERLPADQPVRLHAGARLRIGATILGFVDHRVDGRENHQLQGWTLVERLGAGAAGVVYRARGEDGGQAALKLLDPGLGADPRESLRFVNAARAQGRVAHPNVARVLTAEVVAGQALMVSELAGQGSVATVLATGAAQPTSQVLPWLRDAARGLQAAEERGLAHRGLRPGNLLLDTEGGVVVTDFGTCATYDRSAPQAGPATTWIAPEEAAGGEADARANQFSLGCIAWQALSGALPFAASDRAASALARREQVLPPPTAGHDVLKVLARLLARAPENRYPGWAEAGADLDALVRGVAPATAPLAPGLSALGQPAARTSVRAPVQLPDSSVEVQAASRPAAERITLPPVAIKGLIALGVIILVAGFIVPALNRSAPEAPAVRPTAEVASGSGVARTRVESPSEMIDRLTAEENARKLERFQQATGTAPLAVEAPRAVRPAPALPSAHPPEPARPPAKPATATVAPASGQDALNAGPRAQLPADGTAPGAADDEQATALLADALQAARSGAEAGQQVTLFAKAATANATFGDDAHLLYATALVEAGQPALAAEQLKHLSPAARQRPEAEALAAGLGQSPPELDPQVVAQFAIGGAGDQYIREVGFAGGVAWAKGTGFIVLIDSRSGMTTVQGDPETADTVDWHSRFTRSPKANVQLLDPRQAQTYSLTTLQVHPVLQQPLLTSSAGWKLWGWSHEQVAEGTKGIRWGPLMADSRGYDLWLMPEGRIGVLCWTDGGNSVLTRDPRDLGKANDAIEQGGAFRTNAGGMATMFLLVDGADGTPLSGTFLRGHVTNRVVDAYGRVYLPKAFDGATALGEAASDAGGGLFVLRPDLRQPELNVRLGAGAVEGGKEGFGVIALSDNLLVLGGTSNNPALPAAAGTTRGGGQDGFVTVLRLWEKR